MLHRNLLVLAAGSCLLTLEIGSASAAPPPADPTLAKLRALGVGVAPAPGGGLSAYVRGPSAAAFDLLVTLRDVRLFSGALSEEQLIKLCAMKTIEGLDLDGFNGTSATLSALGSQPNLKKITLSHSSFKDPDYSPLKNCKSLETVSVFGFYGFPEKAMKSFSELTQIKNLTMVHTDLTSEGFVYLSRLKNLETLAFTPSWSPNFLGSDFVHLSGLKSLKELTMARMVVDYDDGFEHLKGLTQLKRLVISDIVTSEADFEKLKRDLPNTTIERKFSLEARAQKWNEALGRRKQAEAKAAPDAKRKPNAKRAPAAKPKPSPKPAAGVKPTPAADETSQPRPRTAPSRLLP